MRYTTTAFPCKHYEGGMILKKIRKRVQMKHKICNIFLIKGT